MQCDRIHCVVASCTSSISPLGSHLNLLTAEFLHPLREAFDGTTQPYFFVLSRQLLSIHIYVLLCYLFITRLSNFSPPSWEKPLEKPYCFGPVWPAAVPSRGSSVTVKFLAASFKGEVVRVGRMDHYQTPRSMERCRPHGVFHFFFLFLFFSPFLGTGGSRVTVGQCKAADGSGMCE